MSALHELPILRHSEAQLKGSYSDTGGCLRSYYSYSVYNKEASKIKFLCGEVETRVAEFEESVETAARDNDEGPWSVVT